MLNVIQSFMAAILAALAPRAAKLPAVSVVRTRGAEPRSVLVLQLDGPRVQAAAWRRLQVEVADAAGPGELVLLDFNSIAMLDSLGIRTILDCHRSVERAGGRLVAAGVKGRLRAFFQVLRLHELIEVFNDADEAASALATESTVRPPQHARSQSGRVGTVRRPPSESNPGFRSRITLPKDSSKGRATRLPLERLVVEHEVDELEANMVTKESPVRLASDAKKRRNGRPVLIGIAGGSCAGKTTLAQALCSRLGESNTTVLQLDSYYRGRSGHASNTLPNFDEPAALDTELLLEHVRELSEGRSVQSPTYCFQSHRRTEQTRLLEARPYVVIEGLFALYWPELRERIHVGVFIDTASELCLERRVRRDTAERGRTADSVNEQFRATVLPMHLRHVAPTRETADIVVAGSQPIPVSLGAIVHSLESRGASPFEVSA